MSIKKFSMMLLGAMALGALLGGCGSSSKEGTIAGTGYATVAKVDEASCRVCHASSLDLAGKNILEAHLVSPHNRPDAGCQGCHGGGAQHNGVGPLPYMAKDASESCKECHDGATITTGTVAGNTAIGKTTARTVINVNFGSAATLARHTNATTGFFAVAGGTNKCGSCHSGHRPLAEFVSTGNVECLTCHDINQNRTTQGNFVNDNNGVRAIKDEFSKQSHHVTGRAVTSADCAVCHLEGKKSGTGIVIDTTYHQRDDKIYLRNGNKALAGNQGTSFGAGYAWQPSNPDHTLMDQFCFSCHNEAGAPDAVTALEGVAGYTGTALNPFGDSISNSYDQVSRLAVVGVYEQFDTGNSSHHAVRGKKYTARTLTNAQFSNISTANFNFQNGGVNAPIVGTMVNKGTVAGNTVIMAGTMFQTGKFNGLYATLNGVQLADNETLHCGDCHTVGQFKPGSATNADGTPSTVVIGAHGSGNEYMLRNTAGDDTLNKDRIVCNICHSAAIYGVPAGSDHNSVNSSDDHCNDDLYNAAGLIGAARLIPEEGLIDDVEFQAEVASGIYQNTGGGNIFAIKCLSCHNASDKKTFGGIHGNAGNASYTSYSGAKTVSGVVTPVSRKPYRFLPGLGNFRYNGGDSPDQWTIKTISQANKQGCYTLQGASTVTRTVSGVQARVPNPSATKADASGANVSSAALLGDNGILGSWGACTDHGGTSVFGGRAVTRSLLRPLTY